jgi:hypothetical protein
MKKTVETPQGPITFTSDIETPRCIDCNSTLRMSADAPAHPNTRDVEIPYTLGPAERVQFIKEQLYSFEQDVLNPPAATVGDPYAVVFAESGYTEG